ncbi:MAG: sarcosine oxidase subunit gamma family protein [Alphaproteobacteria bacterium]|nr:sarcosine oxidase subunit gamma family protein [Alphaproteobacteria bacterium]
MAETTTPERLSALAAGYEPGDFGAVAADGPRLHLTQRQGLTTVQVESDHREAAEVVARLEAALGHRPPEAYNSSAGDDAMRLIWAGPWCWHVVEPERRDLESELFQILNGTEAAVVDLSHSRAVIRLAGEPSRRVLAKGCGLDTHPAAFGAGACAQTALFHVPALIDCLDDAPTFDVYAARGLALSLWQSLCHAGAEYGCRVT